MRPHFDLDIPAIQAGIRAEVAADRPETWEALEREFAETPFPELLGLFVDEVRHA